MCLVSKGPLELYTSKSRPQGTCPPNSLVPVSGGPQPLATHQESIFRGRREKLSSASRVIDSSRSPGREEGHCGQRTIRTKLSRGGVELPWSRLFCCPAAAPRCWVVRRAGVSHDAGTRRPLVSRGPSHRQAPLLETDSVLLASMFPWRRSRIHSLHM